MNKKKIPPDSTLCIHCMDWKHVHVETVLGLKCLWAVDYFEKAVCAYCNYPLPVATSPGRDFENVPIGAYVYSVTYDNRRYILHLICERRLNAELGPGALERLIKRPLARRAQR